ncbi:MAG TPA: HupE/UreJ family protein, partial [Tianweitania sediminis]|nr:HupE/UreJ family protein [Tianweitania sediminis]
MTLRIGRAAAFLAAAVFAAPAYAHHAMEGEMPSTFFQGFVSGFAHPVIGVDHLAFIVAAGLIAAVTRMGIAAPIAFVVASLAGVLLHLGAFDLPAVELLIALSALGAGAALALARTGAGRSVWLVAFAGAGIVHGYAFGESIVGA